jgi:DNA-binding NarL/FixJ family response regulator
MRQFDSWTVLVADGEKSDRALISTLLERIGCVTHEAATGVEALVLAQAVRPDAFVLTVELSESSGYEVCHELRAAFGDQVPIMLVSGTRVTTLDRVAAFLIGADEYVTKPFDPDELLVRVRSLLRRRNGHHANGHHTNGHASPNGLSSLTPRERDVLACLARGLNQNAIAAELVVTPKTVATHIQRILSKLGVHSRAAAVAYAHQHLRDDVREFEAHALAGLDAGEGRAQKPDPHSDVVPTR